MRTDETKIVGLTHDQPPVTPIAATRTVLGNARDLAARVERLADTLLGTFPVPCEAGSSQKQPDNGLLTALVDDATGTQRWIDDANGALSRIERSL